MTVSPTLPPSFRLQEHGQPGGAEAISVRDRLPHARLGRGGGGRRPGGLPPLPRGRGRGGVAEAYLATSRRWSPSTSCGSARARREVYPGQWLPEPLVEDEAVRHAETADSLSLAFLHLLEQLSPVERAVFLLREVFDYPYEEVARIVAKSPDNCRQILTRAHDHMQEGRQRFDVSREERGRDRGALPGRR